MKAEFSKDNTHEENIKVSIDKILGADTVIKKTRRTVEGHRKALFNQFIDSMLFISSRSTELDTNHCMDMAKYDGVFLDAIEVILQFYFNKKQIELIYFFLYDRIDEEGKPVQIIDSGTKQPILMNTPSQLWDTLKKYG